jgi:uncharacterized protein YjbI with pentapeptide repeats
MTDELVQKLLSHQRWLDGYPDGTRADISGLDFTGEDLSAWDFRRIIARRCNFTLATMPARMQGGDFTGSIFKKSFMRRSAVEDADFSHCDLRDADMYYTVILTNATTTGAKFSDHVTLWMWDKLLAISYADSSEAIKVTVSGLKTARAAIVSA